MGVQGKGGAHLLVDDADQVLDAISVQGGSCPPGAGLTMPEAHLRATVELTVSWSGRLGGRVGARGGEGGSGLRAAPELPDFRDRRSG